MRARALLSLGIVLVLASGGTWAYWSDSSTVTGSTLTAGTLDLKVNGSDNVTGYTNLTINNMAPGNSTAGVLTVKNNGTVPFTYTMTSSASDGSKVGLGAALTAKVTTDANVTGSSPAATCAGTAITGSGTSFTGDLIGASIKRTLTAGATDTICVQALLPSTAASTLQGASTSLTLTLTATQQQ